jgi:predicted nucleotidyltransferase component of viral defense system
VRDYATPAAFRAAVEATLRDRARRLGVPAYIVRRQAALERLLVRLARVAPGRWAVKGGMALETRLGEHARVSVDLDADHIQGGEAARADLQRAAADDVDDYFAFALVSSEALQEVGVRLAVRYGLESSLAGRPFEPVQVDVTIAPLEFWDAQPAQRPGLLADLGLDPITLMLVPLERHVAEKLHAYTRTYKGGGTTRVRDIVDLQLIREHEHVDPAALRDAIPHVFDRRATHIVPERLPPPPRALGVAYRREAERVGLLASLDEAYLVLADWLDPVLAEIHQPDTEGKRPRRR